MNLKTLGLTISLVSAGWLGLSDTAFAAKFQFGDTLNINLPSFQINAAGLDLGGQINFPLLPGGQSSGGADGLADALFGDFNTDVPIDASDRVINKNGMTDYVPGDLGQFMVAPSKGPFDAYRNQIGSIRSFDGSEFNELDEVNGTFNPSDTDNDIDNEAPDIPPPNYLLKLNGVDSANQAVFLYLTRVISFDLIGALTNGFGELEAEGWLLAVGDDADVDYYKVQYKLSSQALTDDGRGTDVVAGDGVTGAVSASAASLIIRVNRQQEPNPIPEPSALVGLSVVAGAGLLMKKKKLSQK